jgi:L-threonylcarbamoyladenylate synthase
MQQKSPQSRAYTDRFFRYHSARAMKILSSSDEDLSLAAAALAAGKLVAFPTETVYGLGANAYDPLALARVFEAKRRPAFDPLIVHIANLGTLERIADLRVLPADALEKVRRISLELWPGPLTLILPKKDVVPDLATSDLPTVAVRLPAHPVALSLIALSTGAVAGPSANPFGYLSPTRASHVAEQLGDRVDFIVDGGPCSVGVESTVLDMTAETPCILRPGGTEKARIEAVIGPVDSLDRSSATPTAPGQLPSHYAPRLPLILRPYGALRDLSPRADEAALFFDSGSRTAGSRTATSQNAARAAPGSAGASWKAVRVLSESGDPLEAAANLFAYLHELDASGAVRIQAERAPEGVLSQAINDRLYKASEK